MDYRFPKEFMFGVSTAAYQIEGGWNEDGKGENIWDHLVHTSPELIRDGTNGDIACDSYHKYKEDVALAKNLNVKVYRFSISWARIAPSGVMNSLNLEGIAYYNRLIDELIKNDIIPLVTMYHWDLPQYLQDLGGWVNPIMSDYFKEYARVLFTHYGDRVKWWITINEPMEACKGYAIKGYAPYLNLNNTGYYLAAHTQLIAHGKAYRLYEEMFKSTQQGKISISINGVFFIPKNANSVDDVKTAERANQFERGLFSHPIYKGDYPPIMRRWVDKKCKEDGRPWSTLPTFTEDEIKLIKGTADFYALNHYSSRLVTHGSDLDPHYNPDAEYITSVDESWLKPSVALWLIPVPDGLRQLLIWLKNEYGNPPLIITENGYGDNGQLPQSQPSRTPDVCLKRAKLRNGAIPIPVTNGSISANDKTNNDYGTNYGNVLDDLLSSINNDHCYTAIKAIKPQENKIVHDTGTINYPKRDTSLFNTELTSPIPKKLKVEQKMTLFKSVLNDINILKLNTPTKWFCDINDTLLKNNYKQTIISFHKLGSYTKNIMRCIEKQLVLNEESELFLYAFDKKIELSDIGANSNINIDNHTEVEKIIKIFDNIRLCKGAVPSNEYGCVKLSISPVEKCGMWWHPKCTTILPKDNSSNSDTCIWCKRLWYIIKNKKLRQKNNQSTRTFFSPTKKKAMSRIRKVKNTITKKFSRASLKITRLQNHLNHIKDKMKKITDYNLEKVLQSSNIPNSQSDLIHEIFKAAKLKNPKNRKYSENWLLLCMLFQIRSPSGYKFLRDQNILPLPCVNTIRKHLLAVEIGCGFDNSFFKLLKKKFNLKSEQQKQGVLVLDEIFLRENICVNSRTLTYIGLEDFGEELNSKTDSSQKANHVLVFMWKSLADNFVQPIAVFASHETVKGVDLAKLVIRAILLMENAGGQVVGLTSDGATTNRTMWNLLGISAKSENFKNHFENPYDSSRKVFVFSDAPHLLKTVRNRLYEKKQLLVHPSKSPIKWEHYQNIFKIEANSLTKACPKINKNHFELNNLSKMKVKYAAQLFSMSMASAIEFYKKKNIGNFIDADETVKFTVLMNNMFDSLNRKYPAEGIKKNSHDIEVFLC